MDKVKARLVVYGLDKMTREQRQEIIDWLFGRIELFKDRTNEFSKEFTSRLYA